MSLDSMGGSTTLQSGVGMSGGGMGRMTHSLSTPSGVDSTPTNSHRGGKKLAVRIQMLDDSVTMFQVQAKALGKVLFEQVCRQLNLLEADYFGLEYQETGSTTKYWLDLEKALNRQVGLSLIEPVLRFCVKFYTPDPSQLEEEFTRYLFCLQVKRDLATAILQCNDNTSALMASYIVQASCGDYAPEDYPDHTYLSSYRFVPHQDSEFQKKIMESHKKHTGQTPAEADLNLLETARRCELYGMKMHKAKDVEGVPLNLAVAHMGIAVFQSLVRINTFSWAKIRKLSFKRKRFLIKLHQEGYGYYKDTVEFFFDGRNECKNFWKKCVENHGFFRCTTVENYPRRKTKVLSRGSSFRYSGKTQKEIIEHVRGNYVKRQTTQRSQSFRQGPLQNANRSQSHSISAHPLLPIETADWEYRRRGLPATPISDMKMPPSQMRTGAVDMVVDRHHLNDSPIDPNRSQSQITAAAQVEIYPMTKYTQDNQQHQLDSSRSVSPQGGTWNTQQTQHHSNNNSSHNVRGVDRVRVRQDGHNTDEILYHGINGNVSLDRRGELIQQQNRYDLTLGSDKSSSLSRSELDAGTYDIILAENQSRNNKEPVSPDAGSINNNNNNNSIISNGSATLDSNDGDAKKRKLPIDKAYQLAKEFLMTERTYKKDLDILNTWLRPELTPEDVEFLQPFYHLIESMVQHHSVFLRDLEHRIILWEGRGEHESHRIGDVMLKNMVVLPIYEEYIENINEILQNVNNLFTNDDHFQQIYREFEQQKVCYVPIMYLILKPLHRLLHYQFLLEKFLEYYPEDHSERTDCQGTLVMISRTNEVIRGSLEDLENYVLLCELQRDISGFDSLVQSDRKLIRQGCLLKHSKRGLQQRMFFLFSDILLYASKSPVNQTFKILGHVPMRSLLTENIEHNAFIIFGGTRAITVSTSTTAEKTLWLAELSKSAVDIKCKPHVQLSVGSLKNCSSSEEGLETCGLNLTPITGNKAPASRSNTALHVCWHRSATVGLLDHLASTENQMSGYLLRKFKNSSGWQKLWVVFTSFCLYFYKNCRDDFALASLPLLGYTVGPPGCQDAIQKEFVFKLSFKNHVYFFRAESEHSYNRWLQVLQSTTQTQDFRYTASH